MKAAELGPVNTVVVFKGLMLHFGSEAMYEGHSDKGQLLTVICVRKY